MRSSALLFVGLRKSRLDTVIAEIAHLGEVHAQQQQLERESMERSAAQQLDQQLAQAQELLDDLRTQLAASLEREKALRESYESTITTIQTDYSSAVESAAAAQAKAAAQERSELQQQVGERRRLHVSNSCTQANTPAREHPLTHAARTYAQTRA